MVMNLMKALFGGPVPADTLERERTVQPVAKAVTMVERESPQTKIVEEIHAAFNTAADRALVEARQILGKLPAPNNDAVMLASLGFKQAKVVVEHQAVNQRRMMAAQQAETIVGYQQKYPGHKFIFEHEVVNICKKYNLIRGGVAKYKGEVPTKNVMEISAFSQANPVKPEDMRYVCYEVLSDMRFVMPGDDMRKRSISKEEYEKAMKDTTDGHYMTGTSSGSYFRKYAKDDKFEICAPIADMDTSNMRVDASMKLAHIPDPVVLFPVLHGYLVVSAWGAEGSDEAVVNQKMN